MTKRRKWIPRFLYSWKERIAKMLRGFALNSTIFDDLGIKYFAQSMATI
ncbi:MAG: hypothetical protein MZU97_04075 [Bacillus subtilis]|nr:hypothetical protein [Bacillus subtilis]